MSRRAILAIVLALIIGGIAYYVLVGGVLSHSMQKGTTSGGSGPIKVEVLSVEKGVDAVKAKPTV